MGRRLSFDCDDQSHLQPLEVAIHLGKADFSQPGHLLVKSREAVGRVVLDPPNLATKALVQARGRGTHEIEIHEDTARGKQTVYLSEKLLLSPVLKVVDRQSRHDNIRRFGDGEGFSKVVLTQLDSRIISESLPRPVKHRHRRVEPYCLCV